MNTRETRVYYYMLDKGSITVKECADHLGTSELRKIISNMQKKGVKISSKWESGQNKYGEKTRYKRYFLVDETLY